MFTGIIQATGTIAACERRDGDMRITIHTGKLPLANVRTGDSIAVSGVCLTATDMTMDGFSADVSVETLGRTVIGDLGVSDAVNLETSLTLQTPLGGHLVSGHVDGIGTVVSRAADSRSVRFAIEAPAELARYIAAKGSICVDGVSLTVNHVEGAVFEVNIVPHTLQETTLDEYHPGRRVNLEVDMVARYLERLLLGDRAAHPGTSGGITREILEAAGFSGKSG
jgi:riboflavin synthase